MNIRTFRDTSWTTYFQDVMEPRSGIEPETSSFFCTPVSAITYLGNRLYLEHTLAGLAPLVSRSGGRGCVAATVLAL